jgi:hypothetical protein
MSEQLDAIMPGSRQAVNYLDAALAKVGKKARRLETGTPATPASTKAALLQ